jgi:hypothetical protein
MYPPPGQQPPYGQPPPGAPQGQPPVGMPVSPGQPQAGVPVSPDGKFVWNGYAWVPMAKSGNTGVVIAVLAVGCLVIIPVVVIVLLTIVGHQVNNVFSNISPGLSTPFPTP